MAVSFDDLQIGKTYTRPQLSLLWNYSSYEAISRGVVTPRKTNFIILFITVEKQESFTQYEDYLESGILNIEGESNHSSDNRIINSERDSDQVYLFYRERHHMPFTYFGQINLVSYIRNTDSPSRFTFLVISEQPDINLETELITHGQPNEGFIPGKEGRRIIRQHVAYERSMRNRRRALEVHGNRCKVCGFSFDEYFGPEFAQGYIEIHHIRSISEIIGNVNPDKDLVPLCSNCHSMAHRQRGRILSVQELKELRKIGI